MYARVLNEHRKTFHYKCPVEQLFAEICGVQNGKQVKHPSLLRNHEIIVGDLPARMVLDIDCGRNSPDAPVTIEEFEEKYQTSVVRAIQDVLLEEFGIPPGDAAKTSRFVVARCHRSDKWSCHIVFPDVWFVQGSQLATFIREKLPLHIVKLIDMGIYPSCNGTKSIRFVLNYTTDMKNKLEPGTPIQTQDDFFDYTVTMCSPEKMPPVSSMINYTSIIVRGVNKTNVFIPTGEILNQALEALGRLGGSITHKEGNLFRLDNVPDERFVICPIFCRSHNKNGMYARVILKQDHTLGYQLKCLKCINAGWFDAII